MRWDDTTWRRPDVPRRPPDFPSTYHLVSGVEWNVNNTNRMSSATLSAHPPNKLLSLIQQVTHSPQRLQAALRRFCVLTSQLVPQGQVEQLELVPRDHLWAMQFDLQRAVSTIGALQHQLACSTQHLNSVQHQLWQQMCAMASLAPAFDNQLTLPPAPQSCLPLLIPPTTQIPPPTTVGKGVLSR